MGGQLAICRESWVVMYAHDLRLSLSTPAQRRGQPNVAEDLFMTSSNNYLAEEVELELYSEVHRHRIFEHRMIRVVV